MSGAPSGIGVSYTKAVDVTGSPTDSERVVVAKPTLPWRERSFARWFNTHAFMAPAAGTFGNAPKVVFRGPSGMQVNTLLGQVTSAADPRLIQLSLRMRF